MSSIARLTWLTWYVRLIALSVGLLVFLVNAHLPRDEERGDQFAMLQFRFFIELGECRSVLLTSPKRIMRSSKPNHAQTWFFRFCILGDEFERFVDNDFGRISLKFRELAKAADDGIAVEEVRDREPGLKPEGTRVVSIVSKDGHSGPSHAI